MDTENVIVYIKRGDIYVDIAEVLEIKFRTSKYELQRSLSKEKKL